jgi:hypothetical protein
MSSGLLQHANHDSGWLDGRSINPAHRVPISRLLDRDQDDRLVRTTAVNPERQRVSRRQLPAANSTDPKRSGIEARTM